MKHRLTSSILTGILMLATVVLETSCGAFSSRVVTDWRPAATRLKSGASIKSEVDRLAQPLIASGETSCIAVGVVTPDGRMQTFGYGRTGDSPGDAAPDGESIFQIGSVSKLFLSSLLAILVNEGQLHYEDTVSSILPPSIPVSPEVGALTLYELDTHTSGLYREAHQWVQLRCLEEYLFTGHNLYSYVTKPYLYEYLRTCHVNPAHKGTFRYSNIGSGLLAHLIEVKTGRTIPDLLQAKICRPLRLKNTCLVLDPAQKKRLVTGHAGDQPWFMARTTPIPPWDMGEVMRGVGAMYSTPDDLMLFEKANLGMLNTPVTPILQSTQQVRVHRPHEDVGPGWHINYFDGGHLKIFYKHGMDAGYCAYIGMNAESRIAVVVLCGNFNWNDKIGHNLILRLSDGLSQAGSKSVCRLSAENQNER